MKVIPLSDLVNEISVDSVESTIYRCLTRVGVSHTNWQPDSSLRVVITGFSVLFSYASSVTASIAEGGYLELASGGWLRLLSKYTFGTEVLDESFAQGTIVLTNTSSTAYTVQPGDMVLGGPGIEYRVGDGFVIPRKVGSVNGTISVTAVAAVVGSVGNTAAATITKLITPLPGVSCSNPLPFTSGVDAESDPALRVRAQAAGHALSPDGARHAYRYICTSARRPDGTPIGVTRFKSIADGLGGVDCYVSSAAGPLIPSDLDILQAAVEQEVEPMAVTARVQNATPVTLPITYAASVYSSINMSDTQIKQLIADAIAKRLNRLDVGGDNGVLRASSILGAIYSAAPQIYSATLTLPAADVALTAHSVVVPGALNGTITITPSPGVSV